MVDGLRRVSDKTDISRITSGGNPNHTTTLSSSLAPASNHLILPAIRVVGSDPVPPVVPNIHSFIDSIIHARHSFNGILQLTYINIYIIMLSHILLALGPVGALAASAYAPTSSTCPSGSLVRSADGISDSEAAWIAGRKVVTDSALKTWLETALPDVETSSLPTLALSVSGGGFRSLLTGAGVVQALDGRDSNSSTTGLYQALTYHAGLSGGAWLLSAIAAGNWPTISQLRDSVWENQFAGGILNASSATTVGDYQQIAADIIAKGSAGFPVSLTDPWGRMLSYQVMSGSEGAVDVTMSDISSLSSFTSFNSPFPIVTASDITPNSGECEPDADGAIYEFNPFEFGSWSDDISAFVQSEYLGSNITAGSASQCVTGFDNIDWVLGTSSMLLNEYICNASLGVDVTTLFPSSMITVVERFTSADEYGYSLLPNPFKGFNSTTATKPSTISSSSNLHLVDGGEADHNVSTHLRRKHSGICESTTLTSPRHRSLYCLSSSQRVT